MPTPDNLHFSQDALGFLKHTSFARTLGLFGVLMAFGHSVLAMSGEESLAQVNREIEHPKLKNLKRAAIVIAIYSFIFTGIGTLLAVMLIPDSVRVPLYRDNLIAGMAMYMVGPLALRIGFRVFVVIVGLPDSGRRGEYSDRRLDRRVDARGRRWRPVGLVPQAAAQVRDQLPHREPRRRTADVHDHRVLAAT